MSDRKNVTSRDLMTSNYEKLHDAAMRSPRGFDNRDNLVRTEDRLDPSRNERFSLDEVVNEAFLLSENRRIVIVTQVQAENLLEEAKRDLRGPDGGKKDTLEDDRRIEALADGEVTDDMFSYQDHLVQGSRSDESEAMAGIKVSYQGIVDAIMATARGGTEDDLRSAVTAGLRLWGRVSLEPVMPHDTRASAVYSFLQGQPFGRFIGSTMDLATSANLGRTVVSQGLKALESAGLIRRSTKPGGNNGKSRTEVQCSDMGRFATTGGGFTTGEQALLSLATDQGYVAGSAADIAEALGFSRKDRGFRVRADLQSLEARGEIVYVRQGITKGFGLPGCNPEASSNGILETVLGQADAGGVYRGSVSELARRCGVSRPAVYEALRHLESSGRISSIRKGNTRGFLINNKADVASPGNTGHVPTFGHFGRLGVKV